LAKCLPAARQGYGAFTHSHLQIDTVAKYVLNQEEHHKKTSFREEYMELLKTYKIDYKDEYVFNFFEDVDVWD